MASTNACLAGLLQHKLTFLEKQRDHMQDMCTEVTQILDEATALTQREDVSDLSLQEMNRKIDEMTLLLASKHIGTPSDSKDSSVSSPPPPPPQGETASVRESSVSKHPETMSTSTEWLRRTSVHPPQSGYDTIHEDVRKILSRLDVMESAFSSLRSATEKTSENQTEVQAQMEEIRKKQSVIEEEKTKHLADMEKKVKKMAKKSEDFKQQEKKVSGLEKEIESLKQQEKRVTSIETEIKAMKKQESSQYCDLEKKVFVKISDLEKHVQVNTDLSYHVKSRIEILSSKTEATDTAIQDLNNRMDENKSLIDTISTRGEEDHKKIEDLELKTKTVIKAVNKNQKKMDQKLEKKLEEVKKEYKMVCHMVANRLLPLERLRSILNQKVKTRDENLQKLNDTSDKVTDLVKQVSDLENVVSTRVGFTACYDYPSKVQAVGNIMTSFTDIKCNIGNHFKPSTGVFTAPRDGLYAASLTLWQYNDGQVNVQVKHKPVIPAQNISIVCGANTQVKNTSHTGFGIVEMCQGDTLYIAVIGKIGNPQLTTYSSFSCVLIG